MSMSTDCGKIFVSTSGVRCQKIGEAVNVLANRGYRNIELSGGTQHDPDWQCELAKLKLEFNLRYRLHNYFPAPKQHFVVNLASNEVSQVQLSRTLLRKAVDLSSSIGDSRFGFHAGFCLSPQVEELGNVIAPVYVVEREEALDRFLTEVLSLTSYASDRGVELFVENNVISKHNYESFGNRKLLLLCDSADYYEIRKKLKVNLLLDVAHLKVTSFTLGKKFELECEKLWEQASYIHISDNDGSSDSNNPVTANGGLFKLIKRLGLRGKTITLEIYGDLDGLDQTYSLVKSLVG